jgi:type VI secretion system protein ImpE
MNAKDLITAGRLTEARAQLTADVKAAPSDVSKRVLLFQTLAFLGEWEKAERHLDLIVRLNPTSETGVQVYMNVVHAEKERREVMERKRLPGFVSGVPSYLEAWLLAWDKVKENKYGEAADLYDHVERQQPPIKGTVNGKEFEGFSDTDSLLGPFLEVIMHDRYLWVPFESIGELSVSPPKSLFDLLWVPARLMTWEGMNINCYVPVLYPDSCLDGDERVRLGRMTEWRQVGDSFLKGVGQHVYQAGDEDIALLEIREVLFTPPGKE